MTKDKPVSFPNGTRLTPPGARPYWRVSWTEPGSGERRSTWISDPSDAAATAEHVDQQLAQMRVAMLTGAAYVPPSTPVTVAELAADYLDPARAHDREWTDDYRTQMGALLRNHVLPHVGTLAPDELTAEHARRVLGAMRAKGRATSTQRQALVALRGVMKVAIDRGLLDHNPAATVSLPVRKRMANEDSSFIPKHMRPSTPDVERLAFAAGASGHGWWRPLQVRMAAYVGLRLGEEVALRGQHVDLDTLTLHIREQHGEGATPKGGLVRNVAILGPIEDDLTRRVEEVGPNGLLFPSPRGKVQGPSTFHRDLFRPWCQDADWPRDGDKWRWRWHDLRHHAATWMLEDLGAPPHHVSTQLGHATAAFTMKQYVSRSADNLTSMVELQRRQAG